MIIVIIMFIIIILIKVFEANIKGSIGERQVNRILSRIEGYRLLHDIMLETESGTTQIDHVLIGRKGIFVIETKNYDGWIFGDEKSKYWTQTIYKKKSKFFNPIRQNYGHVKAIENVIGEKYEESIHSVIVFGHRCKLKKLTVTTPVIYISSLKKFILNFNNNIRLTEEEINTLYTRLSNENIVDKKLRKDHVKIVKEKSAVRTNNLNTMKNDAKKLRDVVTEVKEDLNNYEKIDKQILSKLKEYRTTMAKEENRQAYLIFNNETLEEIIKIKPKNKEELMKVRGFGPKKTEKYGDNIVDIIATSCEIS